MAESTTKLDQLRTTVQSADESARKQQLSPQQAIELTRRIRDAFAGAKDGGTQIPPQLEQQMTDVLNNLGEATQTRPATGKPPGKR